jgi:DNA-binding MarR family transcriptional regulator
MNAHSAEMEFIILENIYSSSILDKPLHQRNLARIAGISLGMTNTILKRLAKKGLISVKKLNSRTIHYLVTLEGINEILSRSYRYFKRTIKNIVFYKDKIDEALAAAKKRNVNRVLLAGMSDLEFILEHSCMRLSLAFEKTTEEAVREQPEKERAKTLIIHSETIPADPRQSAPGVQHFYLSRMALETAADVS